MTLASLFRAGPARGVDAADGTEAWAEHGAQTVDDEAYADALDPALGEDGDLLDALGFDYEA